MHKWQATPQVHKLWYAALRLIHRAKHNVLETWPIELSKNLMMLQPQPMPGKMQQLKTKRAHFLVLNVKRDYGQHAEPLHALAVMFGSAEAKFQAAAAVSGGYLLRNRFRWH